MSYMPPRERRPLRLIEDDRAPTSLPPGQQQAMSYQDEAPCSGVKPTRYGYPSPEPAHHAPQTASHAQGPSRPDYRSQVEAALRQLSPEMRARLLQLPPEQRREAIQKIVDATSTSYPSPGSSSEESSCDTNSPLPAQTVKSKGQFICLWKECQGRAFDRHADLKRHSERIHDPNPQLYDCPVAGCHRVGNDGLPRPDKLRDHLRDKHKFDIPKIERRGRKGSMVVSS